jgi:hypothetical protein
MSGGGYKATANPLVRHCFFTHPNAASLDQLPSQQSDGQKVSCTVPHWKNLPRAERGILYILHSNLYCFMAMFVPQLQPIEKDFLTLRDKMETKVSNFNNR